MVIVYIPEGKDFPIPSYLEEGLVTCQEPEIYQTIEKQKCACNTIDGLAVNNQSIILSNEDLYIVGSSAYKICFETETEFITAVFWLVKSNFYRITSIFTKFFSQRTQKNETTLQSHLSSTFHVKNYLQCGCIEYILEDTPVYCLKHIVLSGIKKGPTINSVI